MSTGDLLLGLALVSLSWGIVSMIVITNYVSERGTKINYFLLRLYIIKYINQYKQMTEKENGKPGVWFYTVVISMNLTLLFAIIGFILKK